jgi:hypothetical protein
MPFSTMQRVLIVEQYFQTLSYEADKQAYERTFLMLLYQISQPSFDLLIKGATFLRVSRNTLKRIELCLHQGGFQHML